jgi:hypothetical protein
MMLPGGVVSGNRPGKLENRLWRGDQSVGVKWPQKNPQGRDAELAHHLMQKERVMCGPTHQDGLT